MFHWQAEIAMGEMKERELGRQREEPTPPLPALFLYPQRQRAKISGTKTHVTLAISVRGAT